MRRPYLPEEPAPQRHSRAAAWLRWARPWAAAVLAARGLHPRRVRAAAAADRVAGLILLNSNDSADSPAAKAKREESALRAEAGEYLLMADAATQKTFHPDNLARADLMEARAQETAAYGPERYAAHLRASAIRPDRGEVAAAFNGPKLVLAAIDDVVIPAAKQAEMATRIGAELQEFAGAGHMAPMETPDMACSLS